MRTSIEDIFVHNDYKALIREDFLLRSSNNENFSLRAYSKKVGVSPTTLSMVFKSKRDLSFESYKEVLKYFELDQLEQEFAESLYLKEFAKRSSVKEEGRQTYNKLRRRFNNLNSSEKEEELLTSSLITVLVFNCYDTEYFRLNPSLIPEVLNISEKEYFEIEQNLIDHKCIAKENNEIKVLRENLLISSEDSEKLVNHILDIKDFTKDKIKEYGKVLDKENCLSFTYHLRFDTEAKPEIVKLLKKFQDELFNICSRKSNNSNYFFLNFDFFKVFDISDKFQ